MQGSPVAMARALSGIKLIDSQFKSILQSSGAQGSARTNNVADMTSIPDQLDAQVHNAAMH